MKRLPHVAVLFAAVLLVAADKKPDKAKETALSPEQIQTWINQLSDKDFKVREIATQNLIESGEVAFDAVTKAAKSKDAEVKKRALRILIQLGKQRKKSAIAYFKNLGRISIDKRSPGKTVVLLDLEKSKITDAGLIYLKGIPSLRALILQNTKVTDAGLIHMKGSTGLYALSLESTKVTDAGLSHIKGLVQLKGLFLNNTKVTDAGLVNLKGFDKLKVLELKSTKITDAGLLHLKGLTNLEDLELVGTKVTKAGVEKLKKSLPNCKIKWDRK